jgi:hypothetical protein
MFAHKSVNQLSIARISKPVKPPGIVRNLSQVKVRGPFETFLFDLAPFVLAVAIAFRTVKTVGEIRLEKRSKLPIGK